MRSPSQHRRSSSPRLPRVHLSAARPCSLKNRWPPTGGASAMLRAATNGGKTAMIDFNFTELMPWRKAKALIDSGAIGRLRHVIVTWNVENLSTLKRIKNWKTSGNSGRRAGKFRQSLAVLFRVVLRAGQRTLRAIGKPAE